MGTTGKLNKIFKIVASGSATTSTYAIGGSAGIWTNWLGSPLEIPHNLDFVPGVIAFINFGGQYVLLPTTFQTMVGNSGSGMAFNRVAVNVDETNLYILDTTVVNGVVSTPQNFGGLQIEYYLLQQTAT